MRYKIIPLFLLIPALALSACAPKAAPAELAPTESGAGVALTEAPAYFAISPTPSAAGEAAEPAPAGLTIEEKLSAMQPILDSIIRTAGIEGEVSYDPDDPDFVWTVLYLMGVNYGYTHPAVTNESGAVRVPAKAMEDFAMAAFSAAALPALPETLSDSVRLDAASGDYLLALSDMGETEVRLHDYSLFADGRVLAGAELYFEEQSLGGFLFTLESADGAYPYRVTAAVLKGGNSPYYTKIDMDAGASFDLSGDGREETFKLSVGAEDSLTLAISDGEKTYTETYDYFYNASAHMADTLPGDGYRELYLSGDTGSDDYITIICRIEDGQLKQTVLDGTVDDVYGDGTLLFSAVVDVLGTWGSSCLYRLESDLSAQRISDYALYLYPDVRETRELTTQREGFPVVPLSDAQKSEPLPAGSKLLPVITDEERYMIFERPDGSLVRAELGVGNEAWGGWAVDGVSESDWFGELMYAG